jgi:hypothetical protein
VLVTLKFAKCVELSAATHLGERPESALCSRWVMTQRMAEDAPIGDLRPNAPEPPHWVKLDLGWFVR